MAVEQTAEKIRAVRLTWLENTHFLPYCLLLAPPNTQTQPRDRRHLCCRCSLGRDAVQPSRFCHSGGVCDFFKSWASGHIRACHMAHTDTLPCPQRTSEDHILSPSVSFTPLLINILSASFPSAQIVHLMAASLKHISEMFFGTLSILIYFPLTVIWADLLYSATADEA